MFKALVILVGLYLTFQGDQLRDDFINWRAKEYIYRVTNLEGTSGGTGWVVIAPSGKLFTVTNAHVCEGVQKDGHIFLRKGWNVSYVKVLEIYRAHDLCLIEPPADVTSGFKVSHTTPSHGDNAYIVGHPLLEPRTMVKGQISGVVNVTLVKSMELSKEECEALGDGYEAVNIAELWGALVCMRHLKTHVMTADIFPGNSGSPVLNNWGRVIGVIFAGMQGGRAYFVPLEFLRKFMEGK